MPKSFYITLFYFLCFFTVLSNASTLHFQIKVDSPLDSIAKYKKLSVNAYVAGDMKSFKTFTEIILDLAERNHLEEIKIRSLVNIAIYYQQTDQYEQSLSNYLKASHLVDSGTYTDDLTYLIKTNLGNLYNAMGKYDNAISTSKEIISYTKNHERPEQYLLVAYNIIGTALLNKKNHLDGLKYMLKVKGLAIQMNRKDALIIANNNIGECYLKLNNYNKAIQVCTETLEQITINDSKEIKGWSNLIIGASYLGLKEPLEAIKPLQNAKEIALQGNFLKITMEAHHYLTKAYELIGEYKKSLEEHKSYVKAREIYLKTLSKAEQLELANESESKSDVILEQKKSITFLSKLQTLYLLLGIVSILLLILSAFFFRKRKQKLVSVSTQLKEDKELLENENDVLKVKLQTLAESIQLKEDSAKTNTSLIKNASISLEDQKIYMQRILEYMEQEKSYLDPEIKQSDIAKELSISVHLFSEILNVCFKKNFNNFINLYRVDTAKKMMKDPKFEHYKILSIGYEAGFPSKTSFNRVFKNLVGLTPSEYQKKILSSAN